MNKLHDLFRKPLTPLFGKLVMGLSQNETVTSTLSYAQHFQKSIDNMKMLNFGKTSALESL